MAVKRTLTLVGETALVVTREAGGIVILLGEALRALVPPRVDGRALLRQVHRMANGSLSVVAVTAFFVGAIMVVQSGVYVRRFQATGLVGWGAGYAIFREVGPILIALVFSGRVGTSNTAELGTMTVTEQIDALRALAIDPIRYLVVPRVLAMIIALLVLTILGDLIALLGGIVFSKLILHIDFATLYHSFADGLTPGDFLHGLVKSVAFGAAIAVTSCYFGLAARGGAVGVGRAVNAAVVAAALSIVFIDFLLTYLLQ